MVGTALQGRGGMSSVVAAYHAAGLFRRVPVRYIEAHREISALGKFWLVLRGLWGFFGMLLRGEVRALHVHAASGISFWRKLLFIWLGRWFSCPVIVHLHGGEFIEFFRRCSPLQQAIVRDALERADRVAVLSATWRERIGEISRGLRVEILPNPVDVPIQGALRDGNEFRILFLGRLEKDKGVFDLIEAFALLRPVSPNALLVLGGEGDFSAVTQRLAELGISEFVQMPGWVTGQGKEALLRSADAFVLPSYAEGLPVSMLEAMAFSIPVVVSRVGSVPEVVADNVQGLLIEVRDIPGILAALQTLASSPAVRRRLGQAGRALVAANFSADRVCGQLEQLYAELSRGDGRRGV